MIQHTLLKEVLLNICQLTDPPDSIGKPNLTILRLPSLIADVALKSAVESEIAGAQDKSEFCRDWRNRHIAHLDFDLALGINAKPFKDATRAKVTEALAAIAATLNKVEEAINHGTLNFVIFKPIHGAHSLLHIIDDGLKAGQERETRLSQGKWLPSDTQSKI